MSSQRGRYVLSVVLGVANCGPVHCRALLTLGLTTTKSDQPV